MYFTLRNHRLYSWAMKLSDMHRFLITMGAAVAIWLFWVYGISAKNDHLIDQYHRDIQLLQKQGAQVACIAQECCAHQKIIDDLSVFISPYCRVSSASGVVQSRMLDIINAIKKSGLYLIGCTSGKSIDKDWYTKHIIRVDATGSLVAMQLFFDYIKESKKMIQCSQVHIDRKDEKEFHLVADVHIISLKGKKIPST